MDTPQNFRSAFYGFHREDVVHYLEYLNGKHTSQVNQLTQELAELRSRCEELEAQAAQFDALSDQLQQQQQEKEELLAQLDQQKQEQQQLTAQLEEKTQENAQLIAQLEAIPEPKAQEPEKPKTLDSQSQEMVNYVMSERTLKAAQEQAKLTYYQVGGVLKDATSRMDNISARLTEAADLAMKQLTQLQMTVGESKNAIQDAASLMGAIRPNS